MEITSQKRLGQIFVGISVALAALAAISTTVPTTHAQSNGVLAIGGQRANFGAFDIDGGFLPDPSLYQVVSGGTLDASSVGLPAGCRGHVTRQPDLIIRYHGARSWVRFFVRASGDTTLLINDASGRWHCDDDSGGNLNPMVDIQSPPEGQYDIWVGSYRTGEQIQGQVGMTELSHVRP